MGGAAGGAVGGIRGVVSTSKETSLRVWKGRTQYDQWEVAIEDITPRFFGQQGQQPGQQNGPGGSRAPGGARPGSTTRRARSCPPRPVHARPARSPRNRAHPPVARD